MSSLVTAKAGTVDRVPDDLSGKLQWLCRFGKPDLHRSANWWATIEMNTNTTGSQFTVRTEHTHATPDGAVDQLIARMLEALAAVGSPHPTGASE